MPTCHKNGNCLENSCDECYEYVAQSNYLSGKSVGHRDAIGFLNKQAADYFTRRKDEFATLIRDLADTLEESVKKEDDEARRMRQKSLKPDG